MNTDSHLPSLCTWLTEPLSRDVEHAIDRLRATAGVRHVAIMPDVHLAHGVCVGTVVATDAVVLPQAIGGDIGCGMAALAFDVEASAIDENRAARIFELLHEQVPIKRRRRRDAPDLPEPLRQQSLSHASLEAVRSREGVIQLGTLGTGNHFLELQRDEEDRLWAMVHSGSRGMGQAISAFHWSHARSTSGGLLAIRADSSAGQAYLSDMEWATVYARENRTQMLLRLAGVIRAVMNGNWLEKSLNDCCHNFVRFERYGDDLWLVHRKGALSAQTEQFGMIPGSMGTVSFHVTGRGEPRALRSSSHGAGRVLSRSEARRSVSPRELERQLRDVWFDHRRVGKLSEEAPAAYKDIRAVMRAQQDLTRIVRTLRPVLSYKGT